MSLFNNKLQKVQLGMLADDVHTELDKIGDLSALPTTAKDNLVNAIKETSTSLAENTSDVNTLKGQITGAISGSPIPVNLASQMTDHTRNYIYLGTESGYTSGNLYYWNGSAFVNSGKQYQSTGIANDSVKYNMLNSELTTFNGVKVNASIPSANAEYYIFIDKVFDFNTLAASFNNVSATYTANFDLFSTDANVIGASARFFFSNVSTVGDLTGIDGSNQFNLDQSITLGKIKSYSQSNTYTKTSTGRYMHLLARVYCTNKEQFTNFLMKNLSVTVNGAAIPETGTGYGLYAMNTGSTITAITNSDFNLVPYSTLAQYAKQTDITNISNNTRWKGKKINFLGDSITYGVGASITTNRYADLVGTMLGFSVNRNYGVSGTLIAHDDTKANAFVDRYSSMDNDADLVVVFGGTNDYFNGLGVMGVPTSTNTSEFYGALNTLITGLITKYVGKEIVIVTPYNMWFNYVGSDVPNTHSNAALKDYRDAIINRCEYHGIPVLDLYSISGIDAAHSSTNKDTFTVDGVHPNDLGHQRVADRLVGFLKTL